MVTTAPPHIGRSSDKLPLSRTSANGFALAGPSDLPDPAYNAFRGDLADVALAGRVIAYHYAEPLTRELRLATALRGAPNTDAEVILELKRGERFILLDDSLGWAWGYGGPDCRVGYVRSEAFEPS